ncbi:O-acyltransferase WSD1, partial [Bienertia sinuspersici]
VGGDLYYNLFSNTSFLVSNMVGPQEEISIAGNPVSFIRVTSSSQPHVMTLHMVSYAGNAELQIQVAKEVIPDPEYLVKCFEDALIEMKEAANK